jgi:hypothetical protein
MVDGLLDDEQVAWIRGLYGPPGDTPDGAAPDGDTPDGAAPDGDTPDGAAILTVADLYDLMTAVSPGLPAEALGQLDRLAGSSPGAGVDPRVVEALRELLAGGGIGQPDLLR